jgi:CheY-like chemotaxis protein
MRNPLGQIKYSLDSIEHALPSPRSQGQAQPLSPPQLNTLYRHLAQGQLAIKRGLQVIAMTLDEVSAKPIDPAQFRYLSAAKTTLKAVEEYGYETEGERHKVQLHVLEDFYFKGNETLYIFVLFNLIKNALYYFKLHPQARLSLTVGPGCVVNVKDTGPGIPADTLAQLFQAFSTAGKAEGTGLGLAYCQRAMRAFGGDIRCASVLGAYTEFSLQFAPVSAAEIQAYETTQLQQAKAQLQGKRLLLVEDQPLLRQSTRALLQALALDIDEAENGEQALAKLQQHPYDLILLDLNMPVLDGYATAESLRAGAVPSQQNIPIVAYTSESAYMAQVKTQKVGMNGFVSKPASSLELSEALLQALESAPAAAAAASPAQWAGKTVIVADDEAQNRKMLAAYLERWGLRVLEAEHGMGVLELLKAGAAVDAILMDMQMPGMDGLQTARAIRQDNVGRLIPIVALTANFSEQHQQQAQQAGMNGFVSKPVDWEALRQTLQALWQAKPADPPAAAQAGAAAGRAQTAATKEAALALTPQGLTPAAAGLRRAAQTQATLPPPPSETVGIAEAEQGGETVKATAPPPSVVAPATAPVLNAQRLQELERMNPALLQESLQVWAQQMRRLAGLIRSHTRTRQLEPMHEALHSLLGISGSAGAVALPLFIKQQVYPAVAAGAWPAQPHWLETMEQLNTETLQAIQEYQQRTFTAPENSQ